MEARNLQSGKIIEIHGDLPMEATSVGMSKIFRGATCDFFDSETISRDAKERSASMQKLLVAVVLYVLFMSVEVIGGMKANSLSILTDAAHLLSDVAAFAISSFSLWASGWEANPRQSYGFFRIEILGALVSIQLIWLWTGILVFAAIFRIIHHSGEVEGWLMFAVAAFGLIMNIIMAMGARVRVMVSFTTAMKITVTMTILMKRRSISIGMEYILQVTINSQSHQSRRMSTVKSI